MGMLMWTIILLTGLFVFFGDSYLLLNKKIDKKISILWLFGGLFAIMVGLFPSVLDTLAYSLGVHYPPALFFIIAIFVMLQINLLHSMEINRLKNQVKELTQMIAVDKVEKSNLPHDKKRTE